MLEAVLVCEVRVDCGDVLIVCLALFVGVSKVDFPEGAHLMQAKCLLNLIQCDFLGGLADEEGVEEGALRIFVLLVAVLHADHQVFGLLDEDLDHARRVRQ